MAEIHVAICAIKTRLAQGGGISKDRTAPPSAGSFRFRGIEDFDNLLCGLTAEYGVVIYPEILSQEFRPAVTAKGAPQTHALITMRWHFESAKDGSKIFADTIGEALDTSDKAANKAIQASRKYADITVFRIPTAGDDTEAYVPETQATTPVQQPPPVAPPPQQAANGNGPGPVKTTRAPRQQQQKPQQQQAASSPPQQEEGSFFGEGRASSEDILGAIGETNTFPALYARAQDAESVKGEPQRSELFQAIKMRGVVLFAKAKNLAEVKEGEALVMALGKPAELMKAGNAAYMRFRQ